MWLRPFPGGEGLSGLEGLGSESSPGSGCGGEALPGALTPLITPGDPQQDALHQGKRRPPAHRPHTGAGPAGLGLSLGNLGRKATCGVGVARNSS